MATASKIHDVSPLLTWASCARHSTVLCGPWPTVISQVTAPRSVHGVCQLVLVAISGQMILRPAPHMPVNSRHRSQNPSRAATRSRIIEPQSGQAPAAVSAPGASRQRRRTLSVPRSSRRQLAMELMRPPSSRPDSTLGSRSVSLDTQVPPLVLLPSPPARHKRPRQSRLRFPVIRKAGDYTR
jgi:hypothetical protein